MTSTSESCPSVDAAFLADVLHGLSLPQKRIPSKYLYDERGSQLFEKICDLPEYYPTRTELAIMDEFAGEMAEAVGDCASLVELGSGASLKTRFLLDHLVPERYVPVDISRSALDAAVSALQDDYSELAIDPDCSDFVHDPIAPNHERPMTVYFPGSTIGNLEDDQAEQLLEHVREALQPEESFLLGFDLQKDLDILLPAYDDAAGVTAAFNLNLLERLNRELDTDFDLGAFTHLAVYNEEHHRIEMHLQSRREQCVRVNGSTFRFDRGETICTEYSHKYTVEGMTRLANRAGLSVRRVWTDPGRLFAVALLIPQNA